MIIGDPVVGCARRFPADAPPFEVLPMGIVRNRANRAVARGGTFFPRGEPRPLQVDSGIARDFAVRHPAAPATGTFQTALARSRWTRDRRPPSTMSASTQLYWKSHEPEAPLRDALAKVNAWIEELPSQRWDPKSATIGGIRDSELSCIAPVKSAWSSLLLRLNSQLADPLAAALSTATGSPVVAFYEFEQAAWGFNVYEKGLSVARFWNRPDYVEEDPRSCAVDPKVIAGRFGVGVEEIAPYLNQFGPDADEPGKAFPDDEFELDNHWVRCDFMRRLGLRYPEPGEPGTRHFFLRESTVRVRSMQHKDSDINLPRAKPPWWKRYPRGAIRRDRTLSILRVHFLAIEGTQLVPGHLLDVFDERSS